MTLSKEQIEAALEDFNDQDHEYFYRKTKQTIRKVLKDRLSEPPPSEALAALERAPLTGDKEVLKDKATALFYRHGKTLGEISEETGLGIYELSPWITSPLIQSALQRNDVPHWWIEIKSKDDLPKKPGLKSYEYVECLIVYKGEVLYRPWNCEHECFDDEEHDDHFCNWEEVTHYMPLPSAPKPTGV